MSTRKSSTAVVAKGENSTKTTTINPTETPTPPSKENEITETLSENDGAADDQNTTTTIATPSPTQPITNQLNAIIKSEPDSPTQKMGNNTSGNNRFTRNSPLPTVTSPTPLTPTIKKEQQQGNDTEPANCEDEAENSGNVNSTKKPIRGRKSIKDNGGKESPTKETSKEETSSNKPTTAEEEEEPQDLKESNERENKRNDEEPNDVVVGDKDKASDTVTSPPSKECDKREISEKDTTTQNTTKDFKENKCKDTLNEANSKDTIIKDLKEVTDAKDITDEKACKEALKDSKDTKDAAKESNDTTKDTIDSSKEVKVSKDFVKDSSKDAKDTKDVKTFVITNRLTRHSAAQEVASKTRMTRNRQTSSGAATRPETPPVTGRRGRIPNNARKTAETVASQKRKRSVEDRSDTPVSKMIKLEPKDPDDETETSETQASNVNLDAVKIKQELIESDDACSTTADGNSSAANNSTTTATATHHATVGRPRGSRWAGRKPAQTASPSTRSTRQTKVASPASSISSTSSAAQEPKRRRTGGGGGANSLRRSTSSNTLKTNTPTNSNSTPTAADDDSKDSMASMTDDLPLGEIVKLEKLTPEIDDVDMESKKANEDDEKLQEQTMPHLSNGVDEPLSIETEVVSNKIGEENEAATCSDKPTKNTDETMVANTNIASGSSTSKDASLSPELVSEGVSEISVQQFYKRPQFLENNLGIEEDPKLGEIVQKVTVEFDGSTAPAAATKADATDKNSSSNEVTEAIPKSKTTENDEVAAALNESFSSGSLKEGELMFEESNDGGSKTPPNYAENNEISVKDGGSAFNDVVSSIDLVNEADAKNEEECLQESLHLVVEDDDDGDDDDMTAEESETISMDNNPSLHDDAIEDDDEQEDAKQQPIALFEEIDEPAQDGELIIDEDIREEKTEQTTSNACDNEKAKLQKEEKIMNDEHIKEEKQKEIEIEKAVDEIDSHKNNNTEDKENDHKEKATELISEVEVSTTLSNENVTEKVENKEEKPKNAENVLEEQKAEDTKLEEKASESSPIHSKIEIKILTKTTEHILKETEKENIQDPPQAMSQEVELMDVDEMPTTEATEVSLEIKPTEIEVPKILKENVADTSRSTTPKQEEEQNVKPLADEKTPAAVSIKNEDNASVKSSPSTGTNYWTGNNEHERCDEEKMRQKEQHLKNLGLLTHKAAEKRRQDIIQTAAAVEASRVAAAANQTHSKRNAGKMVTASAAAANNSATSHEYTGTLKTVIKLNRHPSGGSSTTLTATTSSTNNGNSGGVGAAGGSGRKSNISNVKDSGVRRQSLKITFQKGRGRGTHHGSERNSGAYSTHGVDTTSHGEDSYYTIQNENEGAHKNSTSGFSLATATAGTKDQQLRLQKQQQNNNNNNKNNNNYSNNNNIRNTSYLQTHGRKSYNSRSNTTHSYNYNYLYATHIDSSHSEGHQHHDAHHHGQSGIHGSTVSAVTSHKKDDREKILIPEKASSFKFHPGRLCEDQCYYCSGKFGLYDTPCHVGQIKSVERQLKILKNEEKLTVDNCLCDACFRHVDRRANVPSYKKRLSASGHLENAKINEGGNAKNGSGGTTAATSGTGDDTNAVADVVRKCVVPDCPANAAHSLRRKCIRKSVKKFLLNFDMPTGSPYIWLCQSHYDAVVQCSGCVLCKRRLGKNHMYHITSDTERLEKALTDMGIPVQLGIGTAVCKLCRYFANLLMKPPDSTKSQKAEFVKNYRKRLLQFHNIHDVSNEVSDADEDDNSASTSSKAAKREKKENRKAESPTASSSSSFIGANENANDAVGVSNEIHEEQTHGDNEEELMDFVEGETSNEHSKSPTPSGSSAQQEASCNKQSSRLKAILQSGASGAKSSKNSDLPSALLRSNPNLSMRELFPGEEDLGLHFKAPFGSSNSQRTPEGWTRVQTFLQYDEPTRRLWEELQKPYGNQSSFLRHLILLEKYYRNGDLVLSPNASSNASVYTQTVRQRLTSYDQGHCGGLDVPMPNSTPPPPPSKSATPAKEEKLKEKANSIPLVEINDDDEDDAIAETVSITKKSRQADDDDVIIQDVPTQANNNADEKNAPKRRSRSISVDKLTQQLSTNAVTIIARPKETQQQQQQMSTTSSVKSVNDPSTPKRNDTTKLQGSPSSSKTQGNNHNVGSLIGSVAPLSSSSSTSISGTSIPGSIASSSNNSGGNSRSILKSNLLGMAGNKSVEIVPIGSQKSNNAVVTATTVNIPIAPGIDSNSNSGINNSSSGGSTKQQKILEVANKLLGSQLEAAAAAAAATVKPQQNPLLTSPPELVSLQRRSNVNNVPSANSSVTASSSTSSSTSASSTTASLINAKRAHLMPNRMSAKPPPNVVILPDTLNAHERAESKSWRPTLMSVDENQHLLNKNGPLYQTADGRRLPGLVQVQSGGKPFLISIFDYNRMCILRREKLLRDQMLKAGKHNKSQHHHQQQRNNSGSGAGQHNSNFNKISSTGGGGNNNNAVSAVTKQAQAAAAQQQLLQLMQFHNRQQHHHHQQQQQQQQQQAAAMKNAAGGNGNSNRYMNIAPKPTLIPTSSSSNSMMSAGANTNAHTMNSRLSGGVGGNQPSNFPMPLLANALTSAAAAAAANKNAANAAAAAASLNSAPWLWSNFPDAHELLRNGTSVSSKMPPLLPKPTTSSATATITSKQLQQQQQQLLMDNTLMSKIPKSLTVIPQQKLMGNNNNNSGIGSRD